MVFSFRVDKVTLADGAVVSVPADGMTVFIGPNNSGKSKLLEDLAGHLANYPGPPATPRWVSRVDVECEGTSEDLLQYLHSVGLVPRVRPDGQTAYPLQGRGSIPGDETGIAEHTLTSCWNSGTYGQIAPLLLSAQWTGDRLHDQTSAQPPNPIYPRL
ncbi:hypothetical protein [Kitasatospora sp. NPDC008115]|uniref:hypothetical protein n=1 Tax=Kitasatospora sp. NPDC008115 TaxID=3364022 RepID=UPI0036F061A6